MIKTLGLCGTHDQHRLATDRGGPFVRESPEVCHVAADRKELAGRLTQWLAIGGNASRM